MDILNELPEEQFAALDDLLAFISIYDDERRTHAYNKMLDDARPLIQDGICVDAGAGWGVFSEKMARMGARRVYCVEPNPHLFRLAQQRLRSYANVVMINAPIQDFQPPEAVDVLVHEFFGQLLYDEDLYVLEHLRFQPRVFLPEKATLAYGVTNISALADETITPEVFAMFNGALIAGVFDEDGLPLQQNIMTWKPDVFEREVTATVEGAGDVLYLGIRIYHQGRVICTSGQCSNWSYVWTPVAGRQFSLKFEPADRGSTVQFHWRG